MRGLLQNILLYNMFKQTLDFSFTSPASDPGFFPPSHELGCETDCISYDSQILGLDTKSLSIRISLAIRRGRL